MNIYAKIYHPVIKRGSRTFPHYRCFFGLTRPFAGDFPLQRLITGDSRIKKSSITCNWWTISISIFFWGADSRYGIISHEQMLQGYLGGEATDIDLRPPIWSIRIPWKLRAFSPECQRPRASGALWSKVRSEGRWGKRCGKPIGNAGKWSRMAVDEGFLKWIPQIIQSSWMTHDDAYCSTGPWWLGGDPPFVLKPLGILWPRDGNYHG